MATGVSLPTGKAPYVIQPSVKHTATAILLHGFSDSKNACLRWVELMKNELPHVKWVLPNAPLLPITVEHGLPMPAWFDRYSDDLRDKHEDRKGMLESARVIDKHIQDEIDAGIPVERIVIGGFSQGGAMALLIGLMAREDGLFGGKDGWKLGGVVVLSSCMLQRDAFPKMASPHLKTIPILMSHGTADPIVPYSLAQETREILTDNLGATRLTFKTYEAVDHEACQQALEDLSQFLKGVLSRD